MPATPIAMREAHHRLTHYVALAAAGGEFLIMRHGKPLARLGPAKASARKNAQAAGTRAAKIKRALAVRAAKAWPSAKFDRADAYGG
ncbi:MAG: hypothetical protein A3H35_14310 [Betaproteobacteria bacterium RIFCSPLOWO2_02_FULL_62_17]|nr:MAG: hypothetical protein A3H35_14310 [Betaproteobacteria bacterium RIFCSPLOWO2_02_FULL_62_17]